MEVCKQSSREGTLEQSIRLVYNQERMSPA